MSDKRIRVAVLGAGGLGKAAAKIIDFKKELELSVICDSKGIILADSGIECERVASITGDLVEGYQQLCASRIDGAMGVSVMAQVAAFHCEDPLAAVLDQVQKFDAVLIALPNMPNEFIPNVAARFAQAKASLVIVDVLKRTCAVELMLALDDLVKDSKSVVMTGCGATPGFLAGAAVLAAQSFIEVERVEIMWGVGIANWDAYKATIREDIAHLPGYTIQRAKAMTDNEIDALLGRTNGLLELRGMEHADDVLLQRVGVVDDRKKVAVSGVMDTRNTKKPVSTTMTLTGITFEGKRSSHTFTLGDETTMAANVIGPALGYLKRGLWLREKGIYGVFGSTEFLPMVVR